MEKANQAKNLFGAALLGKDESFLPRDELNDDEYYGEEDDEGEDYYYEEAEEGETGETGE